MDAASVEALFDGAAASQGLLLDMFLLAPGTHAVTVAAADHLGNAADSTRTLQLHATSVSLLSNIERSCAEGLIDKPGTCTALATKLGHALDRPDGGRHHVEHNQLGAFVNQVEAQRGRSIDVATADRLVAFARDLIATKG